MEIDKILSEAFDRGASDIHISVGRPPCIRLHGDIVECECAEGILTSADTEKLMKSVTPENYLKSVEEVGGVDYGFSFKGKCRFRASAFKQKGSYGMVLRLISSDLLSFEQIGLPTRVRDLLDKQRGLILVVGPTGSGKSTTLAAMIDYINRNHKGHILTIEDPIEFHHEHQGCTVTQREVGVDVTSFGEALVKALRQDPDVILVGELRDLETMEAAITAAETGHLVFGTLHTSGAARTVDRIIDAFPAGQQSQVRTQLGSVLSGVISQLLLPKKGGGRVAVQEIMIATPSVQNLIREGKTYRILSELQTGAKHGMRTFDAHLLEIYEKGLIELDDMLPAAYDVEQLLQQVEIINRKKS